MNLGSGAAAAAVLDAERAAIDELYAYLYCMTEEERGEVLGRMFDRVFRRHPAMVTSRGRLAAELAGPVGSGVSPSVRAAERDLLLFGALWQDAEMRAEYVAQGTLARSSSSSNSSSDPRLVVDADRATRSRFLAAVVFPEMERIVHGTLGEKPQLVATMRFLRVEHTACHDVAAVCLNLPSQD